MAQSYEFSEEEIRRKLEELGYSNIPDDKLKEFQRGLLWLCRVWKLQEALIGELSNQSIMDHCLHV